ncbi:MAG: DUF47 family protein [Alistipes sp.]|nr:DUF47 family protein [Alistipes sp.]
MNNSFFSRFAPKEPKFFPLFKQLANILEDASKELRESVDYNSVKERMEFHKHIKELERQGDALVQTIADELGSTFITPFDREDIHLLTSSIDDVLDGINSCSKRIAIYNPNPISESGKKLCDILLRGAKLINLSIDELDSFRKDATKLGGYCKELHDIENEGDDIYEEFMIRLFEEEKDSIELIKVKEIMQELERTTDSAEHVGKVLKSLIIKYA